MFTRLNYFGLEVGRSEFYAELIVRDVYFGAFYYIAVIVRSVIVMRSNGKS